MTLKKINGIFHKNRHSRTFKTKIISDEIMLLVKLYDSNESIDSFSLFTMMMIMMMMMMIETIYGRSVVFIGEVCVYGEY